MSEVGNLVSYIKGITWPSALQYFKSRDLHLYSNNSTVDFTGGKPNQVTVLNFDSDPLLGPYTFTVVLPKASIIGSLDGTIFFIYVSQCGYSDKLHFQTATGSTDTVNGTLLGKTFTLYGQKTLFMCLSMDGADFLIHPLGGSNGPTPAGGAVPTILYRGVLTGTGVMTTSSTIVIDAGTRNKTAMPNSLTILGTTSIVPGLESAFVYSAIPTQGGAYGWKCVEPGWYRFSANCRYTASTGTFGFAALLEFDSTGTVLRSGAAKNNLIIASSTIAPYIAVNGTVLTHFQAGYYYTIGLTGDYTTEVTITADGLLPQAIQTLHSYSFSLVSRDVVNPVLNFAVEQFSLGGGGGGGFVEPVIAMGDPNLSTPQAKKQFLDNFHQKRKEEERKWNLEFEQNQRQRKRKRSDDGDYYYESSGPSLSLDDVESVVRKVLGQHTQQQHCPLIEVDIHQPPPPPPPSQQTKTSKANKKKSMVGSVVGEKEEMMQ